MRKILLGLSLIVLLLIIGCSREVVCNKPYILVGTECCLDKNNNSICDKDEEEKQVKTEPIIKEVVKEPAKEEEKEVKTYTIADLQADIGNVFIGDVFWDSKDDFLVLEKDKEIDGVKFYVFQLKKTTKLGKKVYGQDIFKVLPYKYVVVSVSDKGLEAGDSFFNFIKKKEGYLTESLKRNRNEFVKEFSEGSEFESIKNDDNNIKNYINHTSEETLTLIVDNFKMLETVAGKIVTKDFLSLEDYTVTYNTTGGGKKEIEMTGVNYLQSASIFCTPKITITIYHKSIPPDVPLDVNNLENFYKNNINGIKADAQALINMCEGRYKFSYWRER